MIKYYSILGQIAPAPNVETELYNVPSLRNSVVSDISVTNIGGATIMYSIGVTPGGASITTQNYIRHNKSLSVNDTDDIKLGITLGESDSIMVKADGATVSVSAFGAELRY